MKILDFFLFLWVILPSWIRIRNLNADSDPATQINADPDPKPCYHLRYRHNILIFFYFCGSFLPSWIRIWIRFPNLDPLTRLNPDPTRIRICNPGIETPLHSFKKKVSSISTVSVKRIILYTGSGHAGCP